MAMCGTSPVCRPVISVGDLDVRLRRMKGFEQCDLGIAVDPARERAQEVELHWTALDQRGRGEGRARGTKCPHAGEAGPCSCRSLDQ
jgi:hypothetical protein